MIAEAIIKWGRGYLHHAISPLTPEEVNAKLEAEAERRNPSKVKFNAVVFFPSSTEGVELQVSPPPQPPPA